MKILAQVKIGIVLYGLIGVAAVTYGLFLWWPPLAWMFLGAFFISDAWRLNVSMNHVELSDRTPRL